MEYAEIISVLQRQLNAVSPTKKRLSCLQTVPRRNACEKPRYSRIELDTIVCQIDDWQSNTKAELAKCFPGENDNKEIFTQTIVQNRINVSEKSKLEKEIRDGQAVLEVIIQDVSRQAIEKTSPMQPVKPQQK